MEPEFDLPDALCACLVLDDGAPHPRAVPAHVQCDRPCRALELEQITLELEDWVELAMSAYDTVTRVHRVSVGSSHSLKHSVRSEGSHIVMLVQLHCCVISTVTYACVLMHLQWDTSVTT